MPPLCLLALMSAAITSSRSGAVGALSSSTSGDTTGARSPWAPATWRVTLDVAGSADGGGGGPPSPRSGYSAASAAASAAAAPRLVLPLDLRASSDPAPPLSNGDDFVGRRPSEIRPLSLPTVVTMGGERSVAVAGGGWKIELPPGGKSGRASTLRFWIDFADGAERNGAEIPPGRVYFSAPCWREEELELGRRAIAPLAAAAEEAQRRLDGAVSHETGDRRLDGTDVLDTVMAYKDMAELVRDRDEKVRRRREAERYLPRDAGSLPLGPWPGNEESLAIGRGVLLVKEKKLFGDELRTLGRWRATPLEAAPETER